MRFEGQVKFDAEGARLWRAKKQGQLDNARCLLGPAAWWLGPKPPTE